MAQDYHNPDETAYELISRLRKEARGKTDYKKVNYVPHPSYKRSGKEKTPSVSLFKFRRFIRIPMEIMGVKLSTLLMGVSTLLALAIVAIGLTIFFTHSPEGSPANSYTNGDYPGYPYPSEEDYEHIDSYDEYLEYDEEDENYEYDEYEPDEVEDEEEEPEADIASTPTRQEIAVAIRPHIAGLRTQLELTFGPQEWAAIIEELAQEAYYAYHDLESGVEEWQTFVIEHAQNMFLESEWVADIGEAPEEVEEDGEDDEDETEQPTPSPTPTPAPPENNPPNDDSYTEYQPPQGPQIVFVNLISNSGGQSTDIAVPMVNNQTLLDLFVQDFNLRLAVNDTERFPHNFNGMTLWANTLVALYLEEGQAGAEYRLRRNIAALERAEIAQQYVPYS
ncbi:MAG: hypothetical protein FWC73_12700 [Defluviitaleaceae bacterium]|nr:hypothetical protein [Defluviitaleaceae bacterium]